MRLVVKVAAHCLGQGNQEIIPNFELISLPSRDSVDESQLHCRTDIDVVTYLSADNEYCDSKLQSLLVMFYVQKRTDMKRQEICSDEFLEWHKNEFMLQQIRGEKNK